MYMNVVQLVENNYKLKEREKLNKQILEEKQLLGLQIQRATTSRKKSLELTIGTFKELKFRYDKLEMSKLIVFTQKQFNLCFGILRKKIIRKYSKFFKTLEKAKCYDPFENL